MIEISTKKAKPSTTIKQVSTLGPLSLDEDDQRFYEALKPRLNRLLVQPSTACVQAVVQYAQSLNSKG